MFSFTAVVMRLQAVARSPAVVRLQLRHRKPRSKRFPLLPGM